MKASSEPSLLLSRLRQQAHVEGSRIALVDQQSGRRFDYRSVVDVIDQCARLISEQTADRRFVANGRTTPISLLVFLSLWSAGRSTVFVNERLTEGDIERIRVETDASVLDVEAIVMRQVDRDDSGPVESPPSEETESPFQDELLVICTSGTSGNPKILSHSTSSRMSFVFGLMDVFELSSQDRYLSLIPTAHSSGLAFSLAHLYVGAEVHSTASRDGDGILAAVERGEITTLLVVPTLLERIATAPNARERLEGVRLMVSMGARLDPLRQAELSDQLGCPVYQYYGSSETSFLAVLGPDEARTVASDVCGRPTPGTEVRLSPEDELRRRTLQVRTPRAATHRILDREQIMFDEWISTGDLADLDEDGFIHLLGRSDGLIISGGLNIDPDEVAEVISRHNDVMDVAVFGRESKEWGQEVVALCVMRPGSAVDADGLRQFCAGSIASFKVPKVILFVDTVPRGPLGKPDRQQAIRQLGVAK